MITQAQRAHLAHQKLSIGTRKYDLTRVSRASSQRIQLILNSNAVHKIIELDQGVINIYFAPKAKEAVAMSPPPITPLPAPATPPPVEIPAPKVRPGTRFINGQITYTTTGVSPYALEKK